MVNSANGILLKTIRYSDSSAVIQVFSRKYGRKAYFLRGLSKKKNSPRAYLFPLALLELQVTEKESKNLGQVREVNLLYPLAELISNPAKSSIALFLTEIIEKCIAENYQNEILYDFLEYSINLLDASKQVKNLHVWFLLALSKHLGFQPSKHSPNGLSSEYYLNLEAGQFQNSPPVLEPFLEPKISRLLHSFLGTTFDEVSELRMSAEERSLLLRGIIDYYKVHVPHFNHVSSLDVLETVFDF